MCFSSLCFFSLMIPTVKLLDWGEDGFATEAETAKLRASFKQEVAVWHELNHPNVTKVNISALCVLAVCDTLGTFCAMFIQDCQFLVLSLLFSSSFLLVVHLHSLFTLYFLSCSSLVHQWVLQTLRFQPIVLAVVHALSCHQEHVVLW